MMEEICQYLRNWFTRAQCYGEFTIINGELQTQYDTGSEFSNISIVEGQYFRIIDSKLNDGVYKYPTNKLKDETFSGAVWTMSIPAAVEGIAKEIADWQTKYGGADSQMLSPFTSESFGGYSYSKGSSANAAGGITWANVFGSRLAPGRKI